MKLYIKQVEGIKLPSKANELDAGYDVIATSGPNIVAEKHDIISQPLEDRPTLYRAITYVEYDTNLYVAPALDTFQYVKELGVGSGVETGHVTSFEQVVELRHLHLELFPRSSISKYNLVLANSIGTIDNGYRNQIKVRFKYVWQPKDLEVHRERDEYEIVGAVDNEKVYQVGDKIAQLKARENTDIQFELVAELPAADARGLGGFGSSGK